MKTNKPFISSISYEEHEKKAEETYATEVFPFLEKNRKAYEQYLKDKKSLELTPAQKASIQCQDPF